MDWGLGVGMGMVERCIGTRMGFGVRYVALGGLNLTLHWDGSGLNVDTKHD
jgi:hypothetical protein